MSSSPISQSTFKMVSSERKFNWWLFKLFLFSGILRSCYHIPQSCGCCLTMATCATASTYSMLSLPRLKLLAQNWGAENRAKADTRYTCTLAVLSSLHISYAKSSQCLCAMCYQLESIQQEEEIVESFPDLCLAEHHVETHVACRGQEVIRSQLSDTGH